MQLRFSHLDAHLKEPLRPLYVVHGDEALLQIEAADAIRAAAVRQGVTEREVLTVESGFNWGVLATVNQSLSLFGERKLIDLRIPTGKPGVEGGKALEAYVGTLTPDNVTLITLPRLDKTGSGSKWFAALEDAGATIAVPVVERDQFPAWLRERFARQGQQPDPEVLQFVTDRTEGNLLAARQEVEKLGLLLPQGALTLDLVQHAVAQVARYDLTQLSEAFLGGDTIRWCRVLDGLQAEGEAIQLVLWQLSEDVHALAAAFSAKREGIPLATAMRNARVWGKRQGALENALRRVRPALIPSLLRDLARLDRLAKGIGKGDLWDEVKAMGMTVCTA